MTEEKIRKTFDANPDLSVARLAGIAGKSVKEIKAILMPEKCCKVRARSINPRVILRNDEFPDNFNEGAGGCVSDADPCL